MNSSVDGEQQKIIDHAFHNSTEHKMTLLKLLVLSKHLKKKKKKKSHKNGARFILAY